MRVHWWSTCFVFLYAAGAWHQVIAESKLDSQSPIVMTVTAAGEYDFEADLHWLQKLTGMELLPRWAIDAVLPSSILVERFGTSDPSRPHALLVCLASEPEVQQGIPGLAGGIGTIVVTPIIPAARFPTPGDDRIVKISPGFFRMQRQSVIQLGWTSDSGLSATYTGSDTKFLRVVDDWLFVSDTQGLLEGGLPDLQELFAPNRGDLGIAVHINRIPDAWLEKSGHVYAVIQRFMPDSSVKQAFTAATLIVAKLRQIGCEAVEVNLNADREQNEVRIAARCEASPTGRLGLGLRDFRKSPLPPMNFHDIPLAVRISAILPEEALKILNLLEFRNTKMGFAHAIRDGNEKGAPLHEAAAACEAAFFAAIAEPVQKGEANFSLVLDSQDRSAVLLTLGIANARQLERQIVDLGNQIQETPLADRLVPHVAQIQGAKVHRLWCDPKSADVPPNSLHVVFGEDWVCVANGQDESGLDRLRQHFEWQNEWQIRMPPVLIEGNVRRIVEMLKPSTKPTAPPVSWAPLTSEPCGFRLSADADVETASRFVLDFEADAAAIRAGMPLLRERFGDTTASKMAPTAKDTKAKTAPHTKASARAPKKSARAE